MSVQQTILQFIIDVGQINPTSLVKPVQNEAFDFYKQKVDPDIILGTNGFGFRTAHKMIDGELVELGRGDALDAFRHAYASGVFSNEYGTWITHYLGDAAEVYWGNPPAESVMDLFNNEKGRELAATTTTREEVADGAALLLANGELMTSLPVLPAPVTFLEITLIGRLVLIQIVHE